jgi:hypothetical protein
VNHAFHSRRSVGPTRLARGTLQLGVLTVVQVALHCKKRARRMLALSESKHKLLHANYYNGI